jgi:hypothetical protein
MHKFSSIYMGRHMKQIGEPKVEIEGSGEDNELQVLENLQKSYKTRYIK